MLKDRFSKFRFSLKSLLVLILGIAIGYSLNLQTWKFFTGRARYSTVPPPYVIEPPDILSIDLCSNTGDGTRPDSKQYQVGPDGRINGEWGSVYLAGMTIEDATKAVAKVVNTGARPSREVLLNVVSSNSKCYYVIKKGRASDQVFEVAYSGTDTVLDAIAQAGSLQVPNSSEVFVARPAPNGVGRETILPVEWSEITAGTSTDTNHRLMPRDRIYISPKLMPASANSSAE